MLVGKIPASGLGNQLFAYVATKCVAIDLRLDYRYIVAPPDPRRAGEAIDEFGHRYSDMYETAFSIDTSERIVEIPDEVCREWEWERLPDTTYNRGVYGIGDNTSLTGYFLSPGYFAEHEGRVRRWLTFAPDVLSQARRELSRQLTAVGCEHAVAVHVRRGPDFEALGWVLEREYYRLALDRVWDVCPRGSSLVVLVSDQPEESRGIVTDQPTFVSRGDMFVDLCLMSLCDAHVVANSTFSWWGAWLAGERARVVVRPSVWPLTEGRITPDDVWPPHWEPVSAATVPKAAEARTVRVSSRCGRVLNGVRGRLSRLGGRW
jgi:Glycosyl transferase family 11